MSLASRVRETTTVVGTGDATLLGAAAGYTAFTASYSSGTWAPYLIQSADGLQYEEGTAPMSGASTLQRSLGRVLSSSAAGARVDFAAGTKTVDGYVQNHEVATRLAAEKTAAAGPGGGGGGDASAALQTAGNASLTAINTSVGATTATAAGADGTGDYGVIAGIKRGLLNWASLLGLLATTRIFNPGTPRAASTPVGLTVQTSATGTAWVAFGSQACSSLDLINTAVLSASPSAIAAATNLRWRFVGQTPWQTLREGASQLVVGITNANQVEIQRADGSNTQISLSAIAYP